MVFLKIDPPVIAHRGASAYAPENTLIAFIKALELGVKWIEFDVMQATDGEFFIFHDERLDRTTNSKGAVNQFAFSYLQTLDAGSWFHPTFASERIPSLKQAMELLANTKLSANLEIKPFPGQEEQMIVHLLQELADYNLNDINILFSSFSIDVLKYLRKHAPHYSIGLLLHKWNPEWQTIAESLHCVSVHVNHKILTPKKATEIKNTGKLLLCYTVNDPKRALELYHWGVDAVFSDVPDKIIAVLKG